MRIVHIIFVLMAMFATQQVFAESKSCETIANSCLDAGFIKSESTDKGIWNDCMKPIILGKTVSGVTVDSAVVKSCRAQKIAELKIQLEEFQNAG